MINDNILEVNNLKVEFCVDDIVIKAVDNVNFTLKKGEVLAILGESGCGKSVMASAILKLLPENTKVYGDVFYNGENITKLKEKEFRKFRGREISIIPQSAGTSLNPLIKVGNQVSESLLIHEKHKKKEVIERVKDVFRKLELPRIDKIVKNYPHELSGGMKQRVLVAMGSISKPNFIVVDEPTKGLDFTSKQEVIKLLKQLKEETKCSLLLITHDISVAKELAEKVAIMYAGEIIEIGKIKDIFNSPKHPYTNGLLNSLPQNGLKAIKGFSPSMSNLPSGCYFNPRCMEATEKCSLIHPVFDSKNLVRCHNATSSV